MEQPEAQKNSKKGDKVNIKRIKRNPTDEAGNYYIQGMRGGPRKVPKKKAKKFESLAEYLINQPDTRRIYFRGRQARRRARITGEDYYPKEFEDTIKKGLTHQLLTEKYRKIFPGLFDARGSYLDLQTKNVRPSQMDEFDQFSLQLGEQVAELGNFRKLKEEDVNPQNSIIINTKKGKTYAIPIDYINKKIAIQAIQTDLLLAEAIKQKEKQKEEIQKRIDEIGAVHVEKVKGMNKQVEEKNKQINEQQEKYKKMRGLVDEYERNMVEIAEELKEMEKQKKQAQKFANFGLISSTELGRKLIDSAAASAYQLAKEKGENLSEFAKQKMQNLANVTREVQKMIALHPSQQLPQSIKQIEELQKSIKKDSEAVKQELNLFNLMDQKTQLIPPNSKIKVDRFKELTKSKGANLTMKNIQEITQMQQGQSAAQIKKKLREEIAGLEGSRIQYENQFNELDKIKSELIKESEKQEKQKEKNQEQQNEPEEMQKEEQHKKKLLKESEN